MGKLSAGAEAEIRNRLRACSACLLGPGLGRSSGLTELVETLVAEADVPLVLDADGINAVSDHIHVLRRVRHVPVLTPHDGEFARLGGDLSHGDRLRASRDFAREHNVVLVLKGHRTITALPDGRAYVNTTGNSGMAKGGSGDVLSGIITALIGRAFRPELPPPPRSGSTAARATSAPNGSGNTG
jgi:NAD(P)H-hydrate epimerase